MGAGGDGGDPALRVLSLGAGVQSTTLALMAAAGELPALDVAIFADMGWEPAAVYLHLERLEAALGSSGIVVHRVSGGDIRRDVVDPQRRFASLPYFTLALNRPGMSGDFISWRMRSWRVPASTRVSFVSGRSGR
nr:hypothetical protein [Jiangella alba]